MLELHVQSQVVREFLDAVAGWMKAVAGSPEEGELGRRVFELVGHQEVLDQLPDMCRDAAEAYLEAAEGGSVAAARQESLEALLLAAFEHLD